MESVNGHPLEECGYGYAGMSIGCNVWSTKGWAGTKLDLEPYFIQSCTKTVLGLITDQSVQANSGHLGAKIKHLDQAMVK